MTVDISLWVGGEPRPQGSMKAFSPKGTNRVAITSDSPGLSDWRTLVAWGIQQAYRKAEHGLILGPVEVRADFVFSVPQSRRFVRAQAAPPMTTKPDVDKLARAILDAGSNVIWRDDAQVTLLVATKRYGWPYDAQPGVQLRIREAS